MADSEIVQKIVSQMSMIVTLQMMGRYAESQSKAAHLQRQAERFAEHVISLVMTHKDAVSRWMATQRK